MSFIYYDLFALKSSCILDKIFQQKGWNGNSVSKFQNNLVLFTKLHVYEIFKSYMKTKITRNTIVLTVQIIQIFPIKW